MIVLSLFNRNQGQREGGREGAFAPSHIPKIFLIPCGIFSNILIDHPKKLIKGQIFSKMTTIQGSSQRSVSVLGVLVN
jgi:hypothetical protein